MNPSDDTKLQVLHEHYKDTFTHLRAYLKTRDRLLAYLLVLVVVLLFHRASPQEFAMVISSTLKDRLGISENVAFNLSFISNVLWFIQLCLVLRYNQATVHINRQYEYIHNLEAEIKIHYGGVPFTREGVAYLTGYPLLSKWAHFLYTLVFPTTFLIVIFLLVKADWPGRKGMTETYLLNAVMCLGIAITVLLVLIPRLMKILHKS
jgi:hypothetical protein